MNEEHFSSDSGRRAQRVSSAPGTVEHHATINRGPRRIVVAVALAAVLALIFFVNLPYLMAFKRGVQAYLYGYSLVSMDVTRQVMTAPQVALVPGSRPMLGTGPINQFTHAEVFPDPTFKRVVAPNADTLYSIAWLDLKAEPLVLSTPDMHGRWVLMEVLDGWTNAYASLGTRQFGGGPRQFLITGPGWTGNVPAGMIQIKSPTNMSWIIGRTYTKDAADFPAVHALQVQYRLTTLSKFLNQPIAVAPVHATGSVIDTTTPVVTQVARLNAREFFSRLAVLMEDNPPSPSDKVMVDVLGRLSIVAGQPFAWDRLDLATRNGLKDAVWFVHALFEARSPGTQGPVDTNRVQKALFRWTNAAMNKVMLNSHNGWIIPLNLGRYGSNYALRAIVTLVGLGANRPEDAVYPFTAVDEEGHPLDGKNRYRLHFERNELPPAKTFWSLTMYDSEGFFVENPIRRYAIGDRHDLHFNQDGSLDLWMQHQQPEGDNISNWLPAPAGPFKVYLRLYDPKPEVLENRWIPPAMQRIH